MEEINWVKPLQWGLWAIAMALVMGWLSRSRSKRRKPGQENLLVYPSSTLIVGFVCVLLFATLEILTIVIENDFTNVFTHTFLIGLSLLGLYLIAEYLFVKIKVTNDGLIFRRFYGTVDGILWDDVAELSYSETRKWFRVEAGSGVVFRVSSSLSGLEDFAAAALARVPRHAMAPGTEDVLRKTAGGDLPRLWM